MNLKQALNHRLLLKIVYRVIKFSQEAWLKLRKSAKNDFEKDFFKLMKNAVFEKLENVRKHEDINL